MRAQRGVTPYAQVAEQRRYALVLVLDVDAIEAVASERRQLEVDHALADGLQLHRMRDGEPWRLLLEDHLSLCVKLGTLGLIADGLRLHDQVVERLVAELGDVRP